jgi:hypothetical protein
VKAELQRLRAEIRSDRASFSARIDELKGLDLATASTPATAAQAAVALHHGYGAIESLLVRVSRYIEGALPAGSDGHIELLESMALDLEGIRPRVLSPDSLRALRVLLAFRHFFRHAYAITLDARRLDELKREAIALEATLDADLERLDRFLVSLVDATEER